MKESDEQLEGQIAEWRAYVRRHPATRIQDELELEQLLRNELSILCEAGLEPDEAFLIALKRTGDRDARSRGFAREYSERLWRHPVAPPIETDESFQASRKEIVVVLVLATVAAIAIKIPELFGYNLLEG